MRIDLQWRAMRSPSSMTYAHVTWQTVKVQNSMDVVYFSLVFFYVDFSVVDCGYAYGIIPAVFKPFQ
jgi:hypothetical protein